ncbi:MAG: terpene cyclase/mutase family protein, partial [Myxococcales bacterium]|nr:terpene cyclase/mutase family protein [Myxococcales bacterium]
VPSLAFLLLVHLIYGAYKIDVPPPMSGDARAAVVARLRAAFEGRPDDDAPADPVLARRLDHQGPVIVQVWLDGAMKGRVDGYGPTVRDAVASAAGLLQQHPGLQGLTAEDRTRARLKVDVVVGRGPLERRFPLLEHVPIHPGIDGIGVAVVDDGEFLLLPDELILLNVLTKKRPFPTIPDFALGLDEQKTEQTLARRAGIGGRDWKATWQARPRRYFRFRTDSFVERPVDARSDGPPLPLLRGVPPGPEPTKANLRAAALAGARFLVAHMQPNGRYLYQTDLSTGNQAGGGYSIPRHAGTTYFLAEIYRITKEEFLREPIERAFDHLRELIDAGGCQGTLPDGEAYECVIDRGQKTADLGSSALTVVALAEYQRATGDARYEPMARRLAAWILMLQRPDGSWRHRYDVPSQTPDDKSQLLYYSGEAALAMARMYTVTGEDRYARSAERGLDWLVGWYDFFAGGFLYGEEHWTCIASEAIWPAVKKAKYLDFCDGYARFLRNQQAEPGDFPSQPDLAGAYNVTPFVMPNNTPAGSRTEATISTYLLGVHHGRPDAETLHQILAAARYNLRQQIRPDSDYDVSPRADGLGGMPGSPIDRTVRIDYVQHVCSSLIRASELIDE